MLDTNFNSQPFLSAPIAPANLAPQYDNARELVITTARALSSDGNQASIELSKTADRSYKILSSVYQKYQDPTQKAYLKTILSNSEFSHHLACVYNLDLDTLVGPNYMDDTSINGYFKIITLNNQDVLRRYSYDLPEGKYGTFFQRIIDNDNTFRMTGQAELANLKAAKLILLPINAHFHWYLMAIHKDEANQYHLFCLDSLNATTNHQGFFEKIGALLTAVNPECTIGTKRSIIVPQMTRGWHGVDCGAAICYFADCIAQNPHWLYVRPDYSNTECDYSQNRYHIAHALAKQTVIDAQIQMQRRSVQVAITPSAPPRIAPSNQLHNSRINLSRYFLITLSCTGVAFVFSLLLAAAIHTAISVALYTFLSVGLLGIAIKLKTSQRERAPLRPITQIPTVVVVPDSTPDPAPSPITPLAKQKQITKIDLTEIDDPVESKKPKTIVIN